MKKLIAIIPLLALCACWYSFTLKPYPDIDTVFVDSFANETDRFELPSAITEGLIGELHSGSILKLATRERAHSVLSGTVTHFGSEAYTYTAGEEPLDFRVTVRARVRFERAGADSPFWDYTVEGFATYPMDESTKSESQAIDEAVSMLISRIMDRLRTG
ncbi:MAG TPA: hypothetical protein ENN07_07835 [candidate division Zixibacteria bacterium]|nr:hypothetical protein [candidate division Zixibacteria bacterium]